MTKRYQVYKCGVCGNVAEIVDAKMGTLSCCGQEMKLLNENITEASLEKHIPVIVETEKGYLVKVGSVEHPMLDVHYIEFIELNADGKIYKKYLNPGDKPEYEFIVSKAGNFSAREFCNLHGVWKTV